MAITMFARTVFLLLLLSFRLVDSIPWNGPQPTESVPLGGGWSPLPTGVITNPWNIFKRAGQYPLTVCGFIGGDPAIPATCSSGSTCVWFYDLTAIGCCTTSGSQCTYPTACLDGGSPTRTPDGNDPLTMTCPNSQGAKECYTNSYPLGYTEVGCGYKSWATTVLTDGAKDVSVVVTYKAANHNSKTFSQSSSQDSSPSSNPSTSTLSKASSNPSSNPSSSPSSNPSSSPSPQPSSSASNPSQNLITSTSQSGSSDFGQTFIALQSSNFVSSDSAGQATTVPTTVYITKTASSSGGSSSRSTTGSPSSSGTGTTPTVTAGSTNGSSSNIGAIAGGTVGGIVVAGLVAGLCVWFVIRRNRKKRGSNSTQAAWAQSPSSNKYYDKHDSLQGRAELPAENSPAPTYASELDGNRVSELYGRQLYKPYRPPQPPEELLP